MQGKIGLEEHFAIADTLQRFAPASCRPDYWDELEHAAARHPRQAPAADGRARHRDDAAVAQRAGGAGDSRSAQGANELARRANDFLAEQVAKRPDRFQGFAALPMQDAGLAPPRTRALREGPRLQGRAGQRLLADRRPEQRRLSTTCRSTGRSGPRSRSSDVPFYLHPRNPLPQRCADLRRPSLADRARPGRSARRPRCTRCA